MAGAAQHRLDFGPRDETLQGTHPLGGRPLRQRGRLGNQGTHRSLLVRWGLVTIPSWQEAPFSAARVERYWVYEELRKLAAQKLAQEKPGQTLQVTALVHEAYLRLVDIENVQPWKSRGHFFAAAAEAMRRILVENARHKKSLKGGGSSEWAMARRLRSHGHRRGVRRR